MGMLAGAGEAREMTASVGLDITMAARTGNVTKRHPRPKLGKRPGVAGHAKDPFPQA
jgi:hypothetical protein